MVMNEINRAIAWALNQKMVDEDGFEHPVTKDTPHELVDKMREYFNENNIEYSTFSFNDLLPFLS